MVHPTSHTGKHQQESIWRPSTPEKDYYVNNKLSLILLQIIKIISPIMMV
jgi:hypothetical protein